MAEDKKEKPKLNFDDKEYIIEDMSNESKRILNHIDDIQKKMNTNTFVKEQLDVGKESFINKLKESLKEGEENEVKA